MNPAACVKRVALELFEVTCASKVWKPASVTALIAFNIFAPHPCPRNLDALAHAASPFPLACLCTVATAAMGNLLGRVLLVAKCEGSFKSHTAAISAFRVTSVNWDCPRESGVTGPLAPILFPKSEGVRVPHQCDRWFAPQSGQLFFLAL